MGSIKGGNLILKRNVEEKDRGAWADNVTE